MAERIVVNTGPLITFARIECLDVIGQLPFEFLAPAEVRAELDEGEAKGHPRVAPDWLMVQRLTTDPPPVSVAGLDLGEAAVIQLALELEVSTVAIDEWKGRRAALAVGLQVTGVLGLLARAKLLGLIPALRPWVDRALAHGIHYHPDLIRGVLEELGEGPG